MRKLDFISKPPNFSIFKEGANKTNLGGFLFLVYIIIIVLLAIIYFYVYFTNEKYLFDYSLVKIKYGDKNISKNNEIESKLYTEINYKVYLTKETPEPNEGKFNDSNFVILNVKKLIETFGNEDECVIKQGEPFQNNVRDLELAVLYRCNGTNCTIREEDKIKNTSYYLSFAYQGFSIEHQNPENPIQPLKDDNYWSQTVQFLENTNIVYLNWEVIEYEEEKGVFGKTLDNTLGIDNKYYAGDYKSITTFTDDGHMKTLPQTLWHMRDSS